MNGNIIRRRQSQEVEPFRLASKSIVVRPVQASRRVGKVVENDDRVLGNRLESTADGPNNPTADGPNNPTADGKTLKETKKAKRAKGNQKSFTTAIYLFNGVNPKIVDKFGEKLEYKGDTFRLVDVKNFKEKTFKVLQLSENHDAIQLSENHDAKDLIMTEEEVLDMIEQPASSTFTRTGTTPEMRALATKAKIKTDEESKTENQVTNLIAKSKKKSISGESMVIKPLKVVSNSKYYWDEVLNPTKGVAHKYFFILYGSEFIKFLIPFSFQFVLIPFMKDITCQFLYTDNVTRFVTVVLMLTFFHIRLKTFPSFFQLIARHSDFSSFHPSYFLAR